MKNHVWNLRGIGDLRYEEKELRPLKEEEVLLRVEACGICGSDIPRIFIHGAHRMPLVPGHEFAGTVIQTGPGVDAGWEGKRAAVFPLIPCGVCDNCKKERFEMCTDYDYLGSRTDGGFAEYVIVPAGCLKEIPDGVSAEEAAMTEPMAVAVHAMRTGFPDIAIPGDGARGKNALVYGAGTIGLMLAMFLKEAGAAHVWMAGNKDAQRTQARTAGIPDEDFCDVRARSVAEFLDAKEARGLMADTLFECVGSNAVIADCIALAPAASTVVFVGNPLSDMTLERDIYWKILRRQLTIRGVWNSSFTGKDDDDWSCVLSRTGAGRIRPASLITHRFALPDLAQGLAIMRDKSEPYVKIMIINK
ncbi:MAG: galactitol-1-phosphate 5-dehydrogenase [Lachnospiraceae bacterium]|nr:galactitol-1-phosphate 5-dehydrogenase [Lachnospiraceae bacterium]